MNEFTGQHEAPTEEVSIRIVVSSFLLRINTVYEVVVIWCYQVPDPIMAASAIVLRIGGLRVPS